MLHDFLTVKEAGPSESITPTLEFQLLVVNARVHNDNSVCNGLISMAEFEFAGLHGSRNRNVRSGANQATGRELAERVGVKRFHPEPTSREWRLVTIGTWCDRREALYLRPRDGPRVPLLSDRREKRRLKGRIATGGEIL